MNRQLSILTEGTLPASSRRGVSWAEQTIPDAELCGGRERGIHGLDDECAIVHVNAIQPRRSVTRALRAFMRRASRVSGEEGSQVLDVLVRNRRRRDGAARTPPKV